MGLLYGDTYFMGVFVANDDNWLVSHMIPNDGHLFPVFSNDGLVFEDVFQFYPMFEHIQTYCWWCPMDWLATFSFVPKMVLHDVSALKEIMIQ